MAFSVAMCILVSSNLTQTYNVYAQVLLTYFVEQGWHIYGKEFLVYIVHSLIHLTADTTKYGSLDKCSAFFFESYLQLNCCGTCIMGKGGEWGKGTHTNVTSP